MIFVFFWARKRPAENFFLDILIFLVSEQKERMRSMCFAVLAATAQIVPFYHGPVYSAPYPSAFSAPFNGPAAYPATPLGNPHHVPPPLRGHPPPPHVVPGPMGEPELVERRPTHPPLPPFFDYDYDYTRHTNNNNVFGTLLLAKGLGVLNGGGGGGGGGSASASASSSAIASVVVPGGGGGHEGGGWDHGGMPPPRAKGRRLLHK